MNVNEVSFGVSNKTFTKTMTDYKGVKGIHLAVFFEKQNTAIFAYKNKLVSSEGIVVAVNAKPFYDDSMYIAFINTYRKCGDVMCVIVAFEKIEGNKKLEKNNSLYLIGIGKNS